MRDAFKLTHDLLVQWITEHRQSYPPTVINITDGAATGSTEKQLLESSQELRNLATEDGNVILFNIHISDDTAKPITFPCSKDELPPNDSYSSDV